MNHTDPSPGPPTKHPLPIIITKTASETRHQRPAQRPAAESSTREPSTRRPAPEAQHQRQHPRPASETILIPHDLIYRPTPQTLNPTDPDCPLTPQDLDPQTLTHRTLTPQTPDPQTLDPTAP
uniref:Uncharacterized protein n=1 Tax=Knipowitschia caucasica TaxID=637954 RepID=A0AAV2MT99_KNICA